MGISLDRFDVVRRAMALAAHSSDNTPALAGTVCLAFLLHRHSIHLYVYIILLYLVPLSSICLLFIILTSHFV
jgi:hypothetical protein